MRKRGAKGMDGSYIMPTGQPVKPHQEEACARDDLMGPGTLPPQPPSPYITRRRTTAAQGQVGSK